MVTTSHAQGTLGYSFEADLQGFGPNGAGVTVSQDTIGATDGTQSMKVDIVSPATFVGTLTDQLDPAIVGDPPGFDQVIVDLTLTEVFGDQEGFVDLGITVFGSSQPDFPGGQLEGLQAQFQFNQEAVGDLDVGTHQVVFTLDNAIHPLTFQSGSSFNDIFGTEGSGPDDVIPTGFQIYVNKSGTAPWTGYFDNVRFADLTPGDFDKDADVDVADVLVWQRGETDPPLDPTALADWGMNFGTGSAVTAAVTAVPEPSSLICLLPAVACVMASRRRLS